MKFRKKPIIVEAEQWYPGKEIEGVDYFIYDKSGDNIVQAQMFTLEGFMDVYPGDWIITGIAGERYPCKPDIFEKTYEQIGYDEN